MIELTGYSTLLKNSLLVSNLLGYAPVQQKQYDSYNDMLKDILIPKSDINNEDYRVDISPEAYKLTILEGLLTGKK